jgi:cell division protein FtsI (penicillin-binding protein 3)
VAERKRPAESSVIPLRSRSAGGLADARRYTPRGRTVREAAASRDPYRPALELVGTRAAPAPGRRASDTAAAGPDPTPGKGPRPPVAPRPARKPRAAAPAGTPRKARPTPRRPVRKPRRPPRLAEPLRRLRLGTVIMLVLFLVVAGRLVTLQLTDARAYARQGLADRLAHEVLFAPRGAIYDRNHHVLAYSVEARYVFADPSKIKAKDVQPIANTLRELLGVKSSELVPKLSRKVRADGSKDMFEYLARGVDIATGDAVLARNLPGIGVGRDEIRAEPGNDLAANLIGFTGYDGGGRAGLEAGFDSLLAGQDGSRTFEVGNGDGDLVQIPGGYDEEKAARPGSSLQLTIDQDLQYEVLHILAQRMSKSNATFAAAVVLDAHNGEVLAQASYPTYNAANPGDATPAQRVDAASQHVVEPGSIHKVITLGTALETGVINANSTATICPSIRIADQNFPDSHRMPCGTRITLPGILAYSSDVGTITVASHMAPQTLYDFQRKFGLGAPTGEGLPGEAAGLVQPPANWSGTSRGSIPIGLGVSVTPVQMAAVYATIANDGVYVQPHLVKASIGPDGGVHPAAAPASRRVLSAQNAAILRQDLEAVVTVPHATGLAAAIPRYRVAGKTGTGLFVKNGRYAPGEVASFIGMAPADAPRFVVAVVAYTPGGNGGKVAAPAFQQMMQFALQLYHVPPTGTRPPTFTITR